MCYYLYIFNPFFFFFFVPVVVVVVVVYKRGRKTHTRSAGRESSKSSIGWVLWLWLWFCLVQAGFMDGDYIALLCISFVFLLLLLGR